MGNGRDGNRPRLNHPKANHSGGQRKPQVPQVYCQPGTPFMSGSWWAMPLWQSMQVFSPVNRKR